MPAFNLRSPQELAELLETNPPTCALLLVDQDFLEELDAEMSIRDEVSFEHRNVAGSTASEVLNDLARSTATVVLIDNIDHYSDAEFKAWDGNRSALLQRPSLLLAASLSAGERFMESAPNIRSVIAGKVFVAKVDPSVLSSEEIEARLQQFREHFKKTDGQVIQDAESQQLELSPLYVAWLIYLGRGDLIP